MKTKTWLILLGICAVILGGLGYHARYVFSVPTDWKTYASQSDRYTLEYPQYLPIGKKITMKSPGIAPADNKDFTGISIGNFILASDQGYATFHYFFDDALPTLAAAETALQKDPSSCGKIAFSDPQIHAVECDGYGGQMYLALVEGKDGHYVFIYSGMGKYNESDFQAPPPGFKSIDDFKRLLSTFTFTD
ncbi:MAG: hypothetical protein JWN50_72 [Parcubacteria group bacterium]|nr:hypothetical protein [Parcubacteria group bacterium]